MPFLLGLVTGVSTTMPGPVMGKWGTSENRSTWLIRDGSEIQLAREGEEMQSTRETSEGRGVIQSTNMTSAM